MRHRIHRKHQLLWEHEESIRSIDRYRHEIFVLDRWGAGYTRQFKHQKTSWKLFRWHVWEVNDTRGRWYVELLQNSSDMQCERWKYVTAVWHDISLQIKQRFGKDYSIKRGKTRLEIELVDSVEVGGAWRGSCFFPWWWRVHGSTGNVVRLIGPAARDILQSKLSTSGQRNFIGFVASYHYSVIFRNPP